ncbi:MAG: hypothetical protein JNK10_08995 [Cyclobacteriaceae bacterium]|nr:hypothetical protein [Cyclobacteriaceae bacterium]
MKPSYFDKLPWWVKLTLLTALTTFSSLHDPAGFSWWYALLPPLTLLFGVLLFACLHLLWPRR